MEITLARPWWVNLALLVPLGSFIAWRRNGLRLTLRQLAMSPSLRSPSASTKRSWSSICAEQPASFRILHHPTAGLSQAYGAVVRSIEKNSTAERAGLKAGHAIVEIDGKAVRSASDVRNRIGLRAAGSSVTITYLREGKNQTVTLRIAELQ